jgi:lysozyme family protein
MKENFDKAFLQTLKHEGGYVNDKRDPGGMTNLGVTKRVWEEWTGKKASEADMRALTPEKVKPLYKARYWDKVKGDELPSGIDFVMYDFAVNSGPSRAIRTAQRITGTKQDGVFGPNTMARIMAYVEENDAETFVITYQDERLLFLQSLSTFQTFGKGWTRRVTEVEHQGVALARTEVV